MLAQRPYSSSAICLRTAVDCICLLVGYLDAELLFHLSVSALCRLCMRDIYLLDRHYHLHRVQAVQSEVIGEVSCW